jgi:hypothetical protein
MKIITSLALAALAATLFTACTQDAQAMDARQIEQQYGVSGAFSDTVLTSDGPIKGMRVPITLANGHAGHLFIPQRQANDAQSVYVQDEQGLHPIQLGNNVSRADLSRSPVVVESQAAPRANKRSWEKEALIIGGSAGAGTAIGALAGGKKGAGVGAAAGGVGGLIFDLMTRDKK